MNAVVPAATRTARRILRSLYALGASLALALAVVGFAGPVARDAGPVEMLADDDAPVSTLPGADTGTVEDASIAPVSATSRRPARRHRQPLAMPFFSFAPRS